MAAHYVKFLRGTPTLYNNLAIKDSDTLYFVAEEDSSTGLLYLGSKLISSGNSSTGGNIDNIKLSDLQDILINTDLADSNFLVYDSTAKAWVNKSLEELTFIGATELSVGIEGLVPAPEAGQTNLFLQSDGSWADITTKILTFTNDEGLSHNNIIADETDNLTLNSGDIFIIKDLITQDKYQYTAYVYNNGIWIAMDGNYKAENVYFSQDLITTTAIGNISLTNGQATIAAEGKNLKEVFDTIFVKEQYPTVIMPSVSLTFNQVKSYEVGTSVTPSYVASLNEGSYSYGPETGIVATEWLVEDSEGNSLNTSIGTFPEIIVTDDTSYSITATATYDAGTIPVTNLKNPYTEGQINAGNAVATKGNITGYRNSFFGTLTNKNELSSDIIRNLTSSGKAYVNGSSVKVDIPIGAYRVVFAYPANLQDITSITDTNGLGAEIKTGFTQTLLDVEGYNGYEAIQYKVYYIDYANANDTANSYTFTI